MYFRLDIAKTQNYHLMHRSEERTGTAVLGKINSSWLMRKQLLKFRVSCNLNGAV